MTEFNDHPTHAPTHRRHRLDTRATYRTQLPTLAPPFQPTYRPSKPLAREAVGALPNTVIIGAMKCGTTSLHEYLNCHPQVSMSARKETNFFVQGQNWSKGLGWYQQQFRKGTEVIGEASPNYARFPVFPGVPERMHMVVPNAKLIYCVRDPIKRMLSHYVHSYSLGREDRRLEQALLEPRDNAYALCSSYYYQLEQYLRYFDSSQIKLVVLEDLYQNPQETMRGVFEFLGVDAGYTDDRFSSASKTMPPAAGRRRSPLKSWMVENRVRGFYWLERNAPWVFGRPIPKLQPSAELLERLTEQLAPDVEALRQISGHDLAAWKV